MTNPEQTDTQNEITEYISRNPYNDIISSITIPPEERTLQQIIHMLPYMETLSSFMDIIKTDNKDKYTELLIEICKKVKYQQIPSNEYVVRYGEKGNHFYIILSGKVAILIVQNAKCYLNEEEYISHLLNLRKQNEIELLKYTLSLNNTQFYIDDNFDEFVQELSLKRNNTTHSKQFIKQVIDTLKYIKGKTKPKQDEPPLTPEIFIENVNCANMDLEKDSNRKLLYIPHYVYVNDFSKGQIFGYFALENKSHKRTATLLSLEECEFAVIDKETYESLIQVIFEKSRKQFIDIIYSFSIYHSIAKSIFESYYYNFFKYDHNERGSSIIMENEPISKVYFIRSGECSLSTYKSIYELNELIIKYKNYLGISSAYEEQQNEEFLLSKNFKSNLFREFVFEKKRVGITKINNRDVLGLNDMIINNDNNIPYFTVKCESGICEYYTIDKKNYDIMYSREKSLEQDQRTYICKKMLYYIERINTYKKRMFRVLESKDKKPLCFIKDNTMLANTCKIYKEKCNLPKLLCKSNQVIIKEDNNKSNSVYQIKKEKVERYNDAKLIKTNRMILDGNKRKSEIRRNILNTHNTSSSLISDMSTRTYKDKAKTLGLNLYNSLFQSYINYDGNSKKDRMRSNVNNYITWTSYKTSDNKMRTTLFREKTNINYVDCLIMDKFNHYYNRTVDSLHQKGK